MKKINTVLIYPHSLFGLSNWEKSKENDMGLLYQKKKKKANIAQGDSKQKRKISLLYLVCDNFLSCEF